MKTKSNVVLLLIRKYLIQHLQKTSIVVTVLNLLHVFNPKRIKRGVGHVRFVLPVLKGRWFFFQVSCKENMIFLYSQDLYIPMIAPTTKYVNIKSTTVSCMSPRLNLKLYVYLFLGPFTESSVFRPLITYKIIEGLSAWWSYLYSTLHSSPPLPLLPPHPKAAKTND